MPDAVLKYAAERQLTAPEVSDFHALPGNGLCAVLNNETLIGGSMKFVSSQVTVPAALSQKAEKLAMEGKTPLLLPEIKSLWESSLLRTLSKKTARRQSESFRIWESALSC